jgi:hypothetical protein
VITNQLPSHPGEREKAVVDGELDLPDYVEAVAEEVVVAVDAAAREFSTGSTAQATKSLSCRSLLVDNIHHLKANMQR